MGHSLEVSAISNAVFYCDVVDDVLNLDLISNSISEKDVEK